MGDVGLSSSGSGLSQAVTATTPAAGRGSPTAEGAVLGTAAYMSPEQARGRGVDKRTDVWAFGVILYECLTGVGPFVGETATDSIGAVLHKDVDLDRLPEETPRRVRHVLGRCLERDKGRRYRDIGDVRIELERAREEPRGMGAVMSGGEVGGGRLGVAGWLGWVVALVVMGFAASSLSVFGVRGEGRVVRTSIVGPEGWEVLSYSISPDGTRIVALCDKLDPALGKGTGEEWVFVRRLSDEEWGRVDGSLNSWQADFGPDGETIAFLRSDPDIAGEYELMRVPSDLSRAPVRVWRLDDMANVPSPRWFCWTPDGDLIFSEKRDEVLRIVDPGTGQSVGTLELTGEFDGQRTLAAFGGAFGDRHIAVGLSGFNDRGYQEDIGLIDLDTGERRTVVREGRALRLLGDGSVLFGRGEVIYRSGWDWESMRLRGELEPLQTGVHLREVWGNALFDVSVPGDLVYMQGGVVGGDRRVVVVGVDGVERVWGEGGRPFEDGIRISPDGERFAVLVVNPRGTFEVWAGEVDGDRLRRLHGDESFDVVNPLFSWDGEYVYATEAGGEFEDLRLVRMRFDGGGTVERLWAGGSYADFHRLHSVNEDGTRFLFNRQVEGEPRVVELDLTAPPGDDGEIPMREVMPNVDAWTAQYDPLGRGLISYMSAPSGRRELFVRAWDPEGSGSLGPAVSVRGELNFYSWGVEPGAGDVESGGAGERLFIWAVATGGTYTKTEVLLEGGRVRLGEPVDTGLEELVNSVAGDMSLSGMRVGVRRGESEQVVNRVELVQGLLPGER
ncbi:MAG: protein kinase, partial [Phycisphaerales bacterium JB040]